MAQGQGNTPTGRRVRNPPGADQSPDSSSAGSSGKAPPPKGNSSGLVSRIGPFEIDWPRSLGYFGACGLAVAIGIVDPPVGVFIAVVPFLKMLNITGAPAPSRFVGQVVEGMAKPVGGDTQGTVRLVIADRGTDVPPVGQSG